MDGIKPELEKDCDCSDPDGVSDRCDVHVLSYRSEILLMDRVIDEARRALDAIQDSDLLAKVRSAIEDLDCWRGPSARR